MICFFCCYYFGFKYESFWALGPVWHGGRHGANLTRRFLWANSNNFCHFRKMTTKNSLRTLFCLCPGVTMHGKALIISQLCEHFHFTKICTKILKFTLPVTCLRYEKAISFGISSRHISLLTWHFITNNHICIIFHICAFKSKIVLTSHVKNAVFSFKDAF